MKVFYFSLTKGKKVNCLLHQTGKLVDGAEIYFKERNKMSIAKAYNKAIDFCIKEGVDYLVLCHDDVILENVTEAKLLENFDQFDMFGVAGATECKLEKPALWHLMGGGFSGGNLHGAVSHLQGNTKGMTSFGPYPHRAVMIDGVFMAIHGTPGEDGVLQSYFDLLNIPYNCCGSFESALTFYMIFSYWENKTWLSNIDFVVVGSGIVGLNCALELRTKHPKSKIVVLEKGLIPYGASSRNAGFACFGSLSEIIDDLKFQTYVLWKFHTQF